MILELVLDLDVFLVSLEYLASEFEMNYFLVNQ